MNAFIAALAFILVSAVAGSMLLDRIQVSSAERFATSGVRLEAEH